MGARRIFADPLVADLNGAKRLLEAKRFGQLSQVALWGPGLDGELRSLRHLRRGLRLTVTERHPWWGLDGAAEEDQAAVRDGIARQFHELIHREVDLTGASQGRIAVRWHHAADPPPVSFGVRLVACALAVARRGADPRQPPHSRAGSLADVFARRRR